MKTKTFRILIYLIFIATMLLSGALSPQKTVSAIGNITNLQVIPDNDNIENATTLTTPISLSVTLDTTEATSQLGIDPVPIQGGECNIASTQATIWYQYAPASATAISIDTANSNYDTFIAIWLGPTSGITSKDDLIFIDCNDDANVSTLTSELVRRLDPVSVGTTYYIEIGQYVTAASSLESLKK